MEPNQPAPACPICGALIPADALFGQCPACLLEGSMAGHDDEADDWLPALDLPRRFGDYELLRQVGCGGMGVVYEARHEPSGRRVALKMIRPDLASRRFLRRFLIEGEAAARLDHPNIIPIREIKEAGPDSFFTMEFVEGETLKDRLRRASGSGLGSAENFQREAAQLMEAVAGAVHHAHERGVFHRDLKPGNILLSPEGAPHIADFGVAKIIQQEERTEERSTLTVPGAALGTPEYMSPEQATGSVPAGSAAVAAADLYSLGAILYELLTGRPPFRGSSNLETLQKVREGDLKRPAQLNPKVHPDLETICLKCLERNPDARYASAAALAADLRRWLEDRPILARPISRPVRLQRWVKRNPVGSALILSLLFGLGILAGLVAMLADRMRTAELNKAVERETYLQKINDWWALPAITNVVIPAGLLAEIRDQTPLAFVEGRDLRVRFGLCVDTDPITRAYGVAPILGELEESMSRQLGRAVFIDLHLSKTLPLDSLLLGPAAADFQRLDAISYITARARFPGIEPLLRENEADEIVVCTLSASGLSNLTQLAGRSIGFGDRQSAVTIQAQQALLRAGLSPTNLGPVRYFTSQAVVSTTHLPEFGQAEIVTDMREVKAGREALRHLLLGQVEAAVTLKRYFEMRRHRGPGLRIIARLPGTPEVFAARAGVEAEVRDAFRDALLGRNDSPGLGTLSSFRTVSGVLATDDRFFAELRAALTNAQREFGQPNPPAR